MCDKCVIMGGQRRMKKAREQRIEDRNWKKVKSKEDRVKRTE